MVVGHDGALKCCSSLCWAEANDDGNAGNPLTWLFGLIRSPLYATVESVADRLPAYIQSRKWLICLPVLLTATLLLATLADFDV